MNDSEHKKCNKSSGCCLGLCLVADRGGQGGDMGWHDRTTPLSPPSSGLMPRQGGLGRTSWDLGVVRPLLQIAWQVGQCPIQNRLFVLQ